MVKVAIYTRVSTEDQAREGFSLDAQIGSLRNYCKARGWEIVKEYIDDGHSGRNVRRPAYQKMMSEKDQWDMILVVKMDRIHRNSRNFMEMMDNLTKCEKEFTSMQESLDTSTAIGRFVVDIIQRIAQLESEQIGERVYVGMKQKAETVGGVLGFAIPYGYDYKNGKLTINRDETKIVKYMFKRYLEGATLSTIIDELHSKNVLTKHGKKWGKQTIAGILKNPLYCGYMQWDKIIRSGEHAAIIDKKTFNSVQQLMIKKIKNPSHKPKTILQIREE